MHDSGLHISRLEARGIDPITGWRIPLSLFLFIPAHGLATIIAGAQDAKYVSLIFLSLAPALAGAACFARTRRHRETGRWAALGIGMFCWAGGMGANLFALGDDSAPPILLFTLYGVPLIFAAASPEGDRWEIQLVDGALALALGLFFFAFVLEHSTLAGTDPAGMLKILLLFDVENIFIALFALVRFRASTTPVRTAFFGALSAYALVYLVTAGIFNHLYQDVDYGGWIDALISVPFLLLAGLALAPLRPSRRRAPSPITNAGSPLMLPVSLLAVSALLIETRPVLGVGGFIVALVGYGVRTILVQLRSLDEQVRLEGLSSTDGLTGLANRRMFDETLQREWGRSRRKSSGLGLMMIDIDHFKLLNDTLGHPTGDARLREVAEVLRTLSCRATEIAARYGGEEFAVIVTDGDAADIFARAEEVRATIAALELPSPAPLGRVTVSIGVAYRIGPVGDDMAVLVNAADAALYRAKRAGRNCVFGNDD